MTPSEDKVVSLRLELKQWEKSFAASNHGRKPGREDIKANPTIASKYKEYAKFRDDASGKPPGDLNASTPSRKKRKTHDREPPAADQARTPKRARYSPDDSQHPQLETYDSPLSVRKLRFHKKRSIVGPTPQKDGYILGLFDALSDASSTPTKPRAALLNVENVSTPRRGGAGRDGGINRSILGTPESGKGQVRDIYATPLKRVSQPQDTHTSASKLYFPTPTFLKRSHQTISSNPNGVEDFNLSPVVHMPRKPPIKGLSSILADLRRMEDEAFDDEMDAMRELEMQGSGNIPTDKVPTSPTNVVDEAGDRKIDDNDTASKETGRGRGSSAITDNVARVWKKRGQKRQTRRVILRPVRSSRKPPLLASSIGIIEEEDELEALPGPMSAESVALEVSNEEGGPSGAERVPRPVGIDLVSPHASDKLSRSSLTAEGHGPSQAAAIDLDSDSDPKAKSTITKATEKTKVAKGEGKLKKAARKISATAHANFRKLNIKNQNTKAKRGGRLSRRTRR